MLIRQPIMVPGPGDDSSVSEENNRCDNQQPIEEDTHWLSVQAPDSCGMELYSNLVKFGTFKKAVPIAFLIDQLYYFVWCPVFFFL